MFPRILEVFKGTMENIFERRESEALCFYIWFQLYDPSTLNLIVLIERKTSVATSAR